MYGNSNNRIPQTNWGICYIGSDCNVLPCNWESVMYYYSVSFKVVYLPHIARIVFIVRQFIHHFNTFKIIFKRNIVIASILKTLAQIFSFFLVALLGYQTYKIVHFRCMTWCFDICIHCTIKLINILSTLSLPCVWRGREYLLLSSLQISGIRCYDLPSTLC